MYKKFEQMQKMLTRFRITPYKLGIIVVLLASLLAAHWLFKPGYFNMHDDLQMMRQLEMEKCFRDGQLPCRWVPDMGFGYGYPLFSFYPPLPYYLGEAFRFVGFHFTTTAKMLFATQFILSGLTMFVLAESLWGVSGGILSAIFYLWAPYHSVDVFVRGAMNEAWAFVWFPLIFWSLRKLIASGKNKYLYWLSFSYAALLLTHNIMAMIFTPILLLWAAFWWWQSGHWPWRNRKIFFKQIGAAVWALGLAAFFTIPILFEKKFVRINSMFSGYFDWRAHFVSLHQLFVSRFWGWGASLWGPKDGMSFSLGHLHWALLLLATLVILWRWLHRNESFARLVMVASIAFLAFFYAFLAHERSVPLWKLITPLQMAQFPWRLLSGWVFLSSLAIGYLGTMKYCFWVALILSVAVIGWNWSFFRPAHMGPLTDAEKFQGKAWEFQQTAGIYDYLPKTVPRAPTSAPKGKWKLVRGDASGRVVSQKTNWWLWQGRAQKDSAIRFNLFYFPGWRAWIDLRPAKIKIGKELGRIIINIPAGKHRIDLRFTNTPVRAITNVISLLAWWSLIFVILQKCWKKLTSKI